MSNQKRIEITCQGNLNNFGDIKTKLKDYEGIKDVEVRGLSKFSADSLSSTAVILMVTQCTIALAHFIYQIIKDCQEKNHDFEIKVNNQIINIHSNDDTEQIQQKVNIFNKIDIKK